MRQSVWWQRGLGLVLFGNLDLDQPSRGPWEMLEHGTACILGCVCVSYATKAATGEVSCRRSVPLPTDVRPPLAAVDHAVAEALVRGQPD
jgi:hypothetical protein